MSKILVVGSPEELDSNRNRIIALGKQHGMITRDSIIFLETNAPADAIVASINEIKPTKVFTCKVPFGMVNLYHEKVIAADGATPPDFFALRRAGSTNGTQLKVTITEIKEKDIAALFT